MSLDATGQVQTPDLAMYPKGTEIVPLSHVRLSEKGARKNLAVKELKDQVAIKGILEPLTVSHLQTCTQGSSIYEVIHGSRRWMAARQLGLITLPVCVIKPMGDIEKLRVQLINNSSYRHLSLVDEAHAIMDVLCGRLQLPQHEVTPFLHQLGHTERDGGTNLQSQQRDIIEDVLSEAGRTLANYRSNMLKLLNYPDDIKQAFNAGTITRSKLEVLGKLKDDDQRRFYLQQTIDHKLTKAQLLARMGASGDPALGVSDKELVEMHKNYEFLEQEVRTTQLWLNKLVFPEFLKDFEKWVRYGKTECPGLQGA